MTALFAADIRFEEDAVVVLLQGALDAAGQNCLEAVLETVAECGVRRLVIDAGDLVVLDGFGDKVLRSCIRAAERAGVDVTVTNVGRRRPVAVELGDLPAHRLN